MSGLICPHCGTATAFQPKNLEPKASKVSEHFKFFEQHISYGNIVAVAIVEGSKTSYALSVCASCSEIFLATKAYGRDWVASFPIPAINVPEEIPAEIRSAFQEAKLSYAIKAYQACLMMCRTALIRLQREQGVKNLKSLQEQGKISRSMFERANELHSCPN